MPINGMYFYCPNAVQLLSEEYSQMSPNTLESMGFYTTVQKEVQGISEAQKKVAGKFTCGPVVH